MKFVNPSLLWCFAFLIIPILIHLFNLRRFKTVFFSNVRILKEIKLQTRKQSRLRHLIILFSRIGAISMLVLAFARPYFPTDDQTIISKKDLISVYIDNSFSMEAAGSNGSLLETAKKTAQKIISSHRTTDAYQYLDNRFLPQNARLLSKNETQDILSNVDYTYHSRMLSEIIEKQRNSASHSDASQKIYYIISDFQKNKVDLQNILPRQDEKIILYPLENINTGNLYIDSCWFDSPIKQINSNVMLKIRVINKSDKAYEKIPIKLFIDNQQRAISSFNVASQNEVIVEMAYTINKNGIQNGAVEISDYPVTYDDKMFFTYEVAKFINVLCISDDKESPYINALFGNDSLCMLKNENKKNINYAELPSYNLILLNELDDISSGLAESLNSYVNRGGNLVVIPGKNINLSSYNNFLGSYAAFGIGNLDSNKVRFSSINLSHPLFNDVFEKIPDNINLPYVFKYYPLIKSSKSPCEDLITLQNGQSYLSQLTINNGYLYILASPLDKNFTDFASHSIFVPSLYNMALGSFGNRALYNILGKNNIIEASNLNPKASSVFKIRSIDGLFEFIPGYNNNLSTTAFEINNMIENPGHYLLTDETDTLTGFSFNYDRSESELTFFNNEEIKRLIDDYSLKNVTVQKNINSESTYLGDIHKKGILLWKYCIILALLFLSLEILLLRFWK